MIWAVGVRFSDMKFEVLKETYNSGKLLKTEIFQADHNDVQRFLKQSYSEINIEKKSRIVFFDKLKKISKLNRMVLLCSGFRNNKQIPSGRCLL